MRILDLSGGGCECRCGDAPLPSFLFAFREVHEGVCLCASHLPEKMRSVPAQKEHALILAVSTGTRQITSSARCLANEPAAEKGFLGACSLGGRAM